VLATLPLAGGGSHAMSVAGRWAAVAVPVWPAWPGWPVERGTWRARVRDLSARLLLFAARPDLAAGLDASVVERAKKGDPDAFAEVVRHFDARLRVLAFRLMGDAARTDDVLQEAYVKAFRSLPRFRGDASLGTWLYRITYNACLDELRRGRTVVPLDEASRLASTRTDPADLVLTRRDLAAALDQLPPEQRAAVVLVDAEGLDYTEAGEILGIPRGTVGSRLNRAHASLRRMLEAS
jgi:RNA polymerase sigma-70 factor (ECF subfamily)